MICYLDATFCGSDCINKRCDRHFGEEHKAKSKAAELPVAFAPLNEFCEDYKKPENEK